MTNVLLVYPKFTDALWSHQRGLEFAGKKASSPPLGLLTVASMLPISWEKKFVDLNVTELNEESLHWANYVLVSAMLAQEKSAREVVSWCNAIGIKVIAGGPLYTSEYGANGGFDGIDHVVVGEAEGIIDVLRADLENNCAKAIYRTTIWPDVTTTPIPMWSLVNLDDYAMVNLQFTRGCPYNCEFCDVIIKNGRRPRTKNEHQITAELNALFAQGWRGHVFVCDDNFIGDKQAIRQHVLPTILEWVKSHNYPFSFSAAVSIDLADNPDLVKMMVNIGFERVTVGIETPYIPTLIEIGKTQNCQMDLLAAVRSLQNLGLEVQSGFIVGFDSDPADIFDQQITFIQDSGIVTAMLSLLFAFPETRLHQRLNAEKRLQKIQINDSAVGILNFQPLIEEDTLIRGHRYVLSTLYEPGPYYDRIRVFIRNYCAPNKPLVKITFEQILLFLKSVWLLGIRDHGRKQYFSLLAFTLLHSTRAFPLVVRLTIMGYFVRKDIEEYVQKSTP